MKNEIAPELLTQWATLLGVDESQIIDGRPTLEPFGLAPVKAQGTVHIYDFEVIDDLVFKKDGLPYKRGGDARGAATKAGKRHAVVLRIKGGYVWYEE